MLDAKLGHAWSCVGEMVRQLPGADAAARVQRGEEGAFWGRQIPGWRPSGSERAFGDWKGGKPL